MRGPVRPESETSTRIRNAYLWLVFGGVLILAAVAAGTLSVWRKPVEPAPKAAASEPEPLGDEITVPGRLQAAHLVSVAASIDGVIENWEVEEGQEVVEGQLLARISNSNLQATKERADAELERVRTRVSNIEGQILAARLEAARAEADFSRAATEAALLEKVHLREQMLLKEGATPRLKAEKAEREYKAVREEAETNKSLAASTAERVAKLEKDLDLAKKAIEDKQEEAEQAQDAINASTVVAPADGVVVKLGAEPGAEIERNQQNLVQLAVDPAMMEIVADPDPRALGKLQAGLPAVVLVPEVTSEALSGEVKEVKDNQVIVSFTSPTPAIRHGMTASARIKLP